MINEENKPSLNFIQQRIEEAIKKPSHSGEIVTRFPPEPNGYLHIGHAKSICLNFGLARQYGGSCHLRFDDTNPSKEEIEYIESIKEDLRWLGFDWGDHEYYASDYFEKLYGFALQLIEKGKAYICSLSAEEIREYRGTLTSSGRESPYRNRSIEENLDLFQRMRAGEFPDGAHVLRAKIDMASPNINMRDPALYRILRTQHHRTGDQWSIYPMYDFAHCLSDMIEGITHSICTLEFEDHRPLYDWVLDALATPCHPQQIEFARLNLTFTVMSKRKLLQLVRDGHVESWDDPRMPTLSGLRRRGVPPASVRKFCDEIGVAKSNSMVDYSFLEHCIREECNQKAQRVMAVLNPLKLVIDNYPEGKVEEMDVDNNPNDPTAGTRKVFFSKVLYIEKEDFMEDAPRKYFRLTQGREVRLKHAYYVTCERVVKDEETGEPIEIHCSYDPESRGGGTADGRKVKGTIHWVSAEHCLNAQVRLYESLFSKENPNEVGKDEVFTDHLNPDSLKNLEACKVELSLRNAKPGEGFQFLRKGYFCVDLKDSSPEALVFNRTVSLKDSWAKISKKKI